MTKRQVSDEILLKDVEARLALEYADRLRYFCVLGVVLTLAAFFAGFFAKSFVTFTSPLLGVQIPEGFDLVDGDSIIAYKMCFLIVPVYTVTIYAFFLKKPTKEQALKEVARDKKFHDEMDKLK